MQDEKVTLSLALFDYMRLLQTASTEMTPYLINLRADAQKLPVIFNPLVVMEAPPLPSERERIETPFMNSTFFIFYISKEKPSNNKYK